MVEARVPLAHEEHASLIWRVKLISGAQAEGEEQLERTVPAIRPVAEVEDDGECGCADREYGRQTRGRPDEAPKAPRNVASACRRGSWPLVGRPSRPSWVVGELRREDSSMIEDLKGAHGDHLHAPNPSTRRPVSWPLHGLGKTAIPATTIVS